MSELHDIVRRSRRLAPTTRERYLLDIDQWIEFVGEEQSKWTREHAQAFYDYLLDTKKILPQSANRLMASLQYASKWWAHFKNRPELDFAYVQKAKGRNAAEKQVLSQSVVTKLLRSLEPGMLKADPTALRDYAMIVVLLETGMRKMSIQSMALERTLITTERLQVTKTRYPLAWVKMKGSGLDDVAVPLSDTAIAAMSPWITWLDAHGISKGPLFRALDMKMGSRGPVLTPARTALYVDSVNKILIDRASAAGIGHIYPHQFRHTFVTWRINAGLLPHEIASITGHTLRGLGAMEGYFEMRSIGEKVRNSTPEWLRALVLK